jgi:hypothetical protein
LLSGVICFRYRLQTKLDFYVMRAQAKENTKVKDAFQMLVQKILTKNPKKAGQASTEGAAGVFGGGKADA